MESGGAGCGDGQAGAGARGQAARTDGDEAGAVEVDAGNPAAPTPSTRLTGPPVNAAVCVDAEFGDANFWATLAATSRRRGRRRSRALRPGLRRRSSNAHAMAHATKTLRGQQVQCPAPTRTGTGVTTVSTQP